MQWSNNQLNIFNAATSTADSIIVNAVAGSGKTTTIVEVANLLEERGIFLAFNKAIATELQQKLPPHFKASTFHSLGFSILKDRLSRKMKVDSRKVNNILSDMGVTDKLVYPVAQLVGYAKSYGIGIFFDIKDHASWVAVLDKHNLEIPEGFTEDQIISFAMAVLPKSNDELNVVDFDDMLYMPLVLQKKYGWCFDKYPLIIIDEAQDTNGIQLELLRNLTDRVIAVGDRNQAIYAFRGTDYTAMDKIADAFNAEEYPLDVSYRCATFIIKEAQEIVPHIKARDGAQTGSVCDMDTMQFDDNVEYLEEDCMVICRMNAPLMKVAFKCLRLKKKFTILSMLPEQMLRYVKSINATNIPDFIRILEDKHNMAVSKLEKENRHSALESEYDRYDSIRYLAEQSDSVHALISLINRILMSTGGPTLCTIHKSKGLEKTNVFIYRSDCLPAPWVLKRDNPNEIQQEYNLKYVAVTRAIDNLTFVYQED